MAFKFIHAADIHLDSPLRGLGAEVSAESLRQATRKAFEAMIKLALEQQVAFVLLAGDLYDRSWQDYHTPLFIAKQVGLLAQRGITTLVIAGNHDAENRQLSQALYGIRNLRVLDSRKAETVLLEKLGVAVHGRSFAARQEVKNLVPDYPAPREGMFNIGMLHTSLNGRTGHDTYAPCTLEELRAKGYQYWALGHIHQREVVCPGDPWVIFPGCIQGRHIGEAGAKGCTLVEVNDRGGCQVQHVPLDSWRWQLCVLSLDGLEKREDLSGLLFQQREELRRQADGRALALRLRLQGRSSLARVLDARPDELRQDLQQYCSELAGELGLELWLEKVENRVQPPAEKLGVSPLLLELEEAQLSFDQLPGAGALLAELQKKLPGDAFSKLENEPSAQQEWLSEDAGLDSPATLARLLEEARKLLRSRLEEASSEN